MATPNEESNKETIIEVLDDSEEPESSEEQEPRKSDEPTTTTPEEHGVAVEGQQEQKADSTKEEEVRLEPQMEDSYRKLFDQFTEHFNFSKLATDKTTNILEQIQKTLTQIDKISVSSKNQNMVIKQLVDQVAAMDKQLEKINKTIARLKGTPTTLRKKVRKIKKRS
jgi:small-conductance mechanosensitive channel